MFLSYTNSRGMTHESWKWGRNVLINHISFLRVSSITQGGNVQFVLNLLACFYWFLPSQQSQWKRHEINSNNKWIVLYRSFLRLGCCSQGFKFTLWSPANMVAWYEATFVPLRWDQKSHFWNLKLQRSVLKTFLNSLQNLFLFFQNTFWRLWNKCFKLIQTRGPQTFFLWGQIKKSNNFLYLLHFFLLVVENHHITHEHFPLERVFPKRFLLRAT